MFGSRLMGKGITGIEILHYDAWDCLCIKKSLNMQLLPLPNS